MSTQPVVSRPDIEGETSVWDPLVRLGHWALVLAFAVAYLSGEEEAGGPDALHVWSGYIIGGIVLLRVLWGFIGPQHARFSDFVYSPLQVAHYLFALPKRQARRYLGHSPAGGAMVIVLLVCLVGTITTGLITYGQEGKGPLAGVVSTSVISSHAGEEGNGASASSQGEPKREEGVIAELHDVLANVTLALVALHILGVGIASIAHRENLVASMIHGRKRTGK
jgi:cytochrome b